MKTAWLKHTGRWTLRLLKIAGVAISLVLAFQVLVLPWIIGHVVAASFAGMGLSDVKFRVRGASFWQTTLAGIRVGNQGLARVGSIGVNYSPSSLLKGRVETIWLNGAEVEAIVKDGRVDLGPLNLKRSSGGGGDLPFDRLELRASTLVLMWEGRRLWVPMEGTWLYQGQGRNRLDATIRIQSGQVHIMGGFDPAKDQFDFTAQADDLEAPSLALAAPARYAQWVPSVGSGTISLKANYVRTPQAAQLTASTNARGLSFGTNIGEHRIWVQGLNWTASAEFDGDFDLVDAKATADARRVSVDGEPATNVALRVAKENQKLAVSLDARADDWLLRNLKATVGGLFGANPEKEYTADISIGLDTKIPERVADMLLMRRLDVSELGSISANGQFKAAAKATTNGGWAWEASAQQMLVQLSPGTLSVNKGAAVLHGLSGVLRISAKASNEGADVSVMPGSSFWVDSIEQKLSPIMLEKATHAPLAALSIDATPARFSARFDHSSEPWAVHLPAASLRVPELAISGGGVNLRGAETAIHFKADATPSQVDVFVEQGSAASFKSLEMAAAGNALRAGPWKLDLSSQQNEPLVRISAAQTGGLPRVSFHAQSENALSLKTNAIAAAVGSVAVGGTMELDSEGKPAVVGTVTIGEGSFDYPAGPVRLGGVSAVIPVTWNASTQQRGDLTISSIQLRDIIFPPAKGAVTVADTHADVQLDWPFIKDVARIMAKGWVDFGGSEPRGQLTATVPAFALKDESVLPGLIKELKQIGISGTFAANAAIRFAGPDIKPLLSLTMKDAKIANKASELSIEGVNGTVSIDSFNPLSTPGGQRLTIKQANTGKLHFTEGVLTFQIENATVFHVEGTDWGFAGGRVYVNSFRLNLTQPKIDVGVTGDRLKLDRLLDIFAEGRIRGEGTLYGRLPVTITWATKPGQDGKPVTDWSRFEVGFDEGFVYATPGGGQLHIAAPEYIESVAGQVVQAASNQDARLSQPGVLDQFRKNVIDSLRNLDYSVLKIDFIKQPRGSLTAKVVISGKGHGPDGVPFGGIDVNIGDFNEILKLAIGLGKTISAGK